MAYNLKKISPLDLKPSTGIGVSIPFSSKSVFSSVYTTKDQTKYNIINFLLTNKRERIFSPNFGASLRSKLFEQISDQTMDSIQQSLISELEDYFPNIQITELSVKPFVDTNSIDIIFSYRLINSQETDSIILKIENA
jgi:phage baseplate assembly protein W